MKVNEFIKENNADNFVITKNGKILGIKNKGNELSFGYNNGVEVLNSDVKKTEIIKGHADYIGIRL